jgi:hypothetical protein
MKRILAVIGAVFMVGVNGYAGSILWSAFSFQSLYDSTGAQITDQNLLVQLIVDVDNDTDLNTMIGAGQFGIGAETSLGGQYDPNAVSDDVVMGVGSWNWFATYSSSAINKHAAPSVTSDVGANYSVPFYLRWFDDSGTEVGIIYSSSFITPPNIDPPGSVGATYTFGTAGVTGSINDSNTGWATVAPVPEPTSMALMGLGLAAVAVRRRFSKKA